MKNINPCLTVILGSGVGLLLAVFANKMVNAHQQHTCIDKPTHQLIYMNHHLFGEKFYCVNKLYL